jgi:hypothetical protein
VLLTVAQENREHARELFVDFSGMVGRGVTGCSRIFRPFFPLFASLFGRKTPLSERFCYGNLSMCIL